MATLIGSIGASVLVAMAPRDFRMAEYPDGSQRIQGAYAWSQGSQGGVLWKDLPFVKVNEEGQVINGEQFIR